MQAPGSRVVRVIKFVGKLVMHWVAGELVSAMLILFGIPIPLGRWIANLFRPPDPFSALA
jgi:hypothetical protein